jgi:hypothetical protein
MLFMSNKLSIILILSALAFGCSKEDDAFFNLNETFTIEEGETQQNHLYSLAIRFDSLVEDSRCPEDMVCIWEGNARAAFTLRHFDREENFLLDTYHGAGFYNDTLLLGFSIRLLSLYPDPEIIVPHYADPELLSIIPYIAEIEISN